MTTQSDSSKFHPWFITRLSNYKASRFEGVTGDIRIRMGFMYMR
jgi:hypothetical protein